MNVIECIMQRRSIRKYNNIIPITRIEIDRLLEAAICAPSGKNGQPWKFGVIRRKETLKQFARLLVHSRWMKNANCCIVIYLDKSYSYDYIKDMQSCGAAIQNMLLAAYSMRIGSCWIGEVRGHDEDIKVLLGVDNSNLEIVGIVTLGYYDANNSELERRQIESFIVHYDD